MGTDSIIGKILENIVTILYCTITFSNHENEWMALISVKLIVTYVYIHVLVEYILIQ